MVRAELAYVTVVVSDAEAAATVFERDFGLSRTACAVGQTREVAPVLAIGASALVLVEPNNPLVEETGRPGVHHIALGVPDVRGAADQAREAGIGIAAFESDGGLGGSPRALLDPANTAGVRSYFVEPLALGDVARTNGHGYVERLDHLGVASVDNQAAIEAFVNQLGFPIESLQTDVEVQTSMESFTSDKYGIVYHNRRPEPIGGLRVAFITIGDCELEFLQDFDPRGEGEVDHGRPGTTRQDRGAIARYVASRGPGLHHLALKVRDGNAMLHHLDVAGHTMIDTVGRPGSRRSHIGFVHPRSLYGALVHLVEREEI